MACARYASRCEQGGRTEESGATLSRNPREGALRGCGPAPPVSCTAFLVCTPLYVGERPDLLPVEIQKH